MVRVISGRYRLLHDGDVCAMLAIATARDDFASIGSTHHEHAGRNL